MESGCPAAALAFSVKRRFFASFVKRRKLMLSAYRLPLDMKDISFIQRIFWARLLYPYESGTAFASRLMTPLRSHSGSTQ